MIIAARIVTQRKEERRTELIIEHLHFVNVTQGKLIRITPKVKRPIINAPPERVIVLFAGITEWSL